MIAGVSYAAFFAIFSAVAATQWPQIDPRRPAFVLFGIAGLLAAVALGRTALPVNVSHAALLAFVAVAAITDVSIGYVFDAVAISAGAVVVILALLSGDAWNGASGALLAGTLLGLLHAVTRGRGLGLGDVKLASVIGFGVGLHGALICIGAAFVAGALWGVCAILGGAAPRKSVAFAPFLGLGAALSIGGGTWLIG